MGDGQTCKETDRNLLAIHLLGLGVLQVDLRGGDMWEQLSYLGPVQRVTKSQRVEGNWQVCVLVRVGVCLTSSCSGCRPMQLCHNNGLSHKAELPQSIAV